MTRRFDLPDGGLAGVAGPAVTLVLGVPDESTDPTCQGWVGTGAADQGQPVYLAHCFVTLPHGLTLLREFGLFARHQAALFRAGQRDGWEQTADGWLRPIMLGELRGPGWKPQPKKQGRRRR